MQDNSLFCLDSGHANLFGLLDTTLAPQLLYYAYIPVAFVALLIGVIVFLKRKQGFGLGNSLLLLINIIFSLHIFNEILQWITVPGELVYFEWQIIVIFFAAISLLMPYFVFVFLRQEDISFKAKLLLSLVFLPVPLLLPSSLNMSSFDLESCEAVSGPLFFLYAYILPIFSSLAICWISIKNYVATKSAKAILTMLGSVSFLFFLSASDFISEAVGNFEINFFGPLGMLLFLTVLAYLIVKFGAFNVKLVATQVFVAILMILVASELMFVRSTTNIVLVSVTLLLAAISGYFLIRSVKAEIQARERNEALAKDLAHANNRLRELDKQKSEFVSIASHQLRSPLTSIRGYASMLVEGSFGKVPPKVAEILDRIQESSAYMALSIEDFLNVSRIEQGRMKYENTYVDIKTMVERVVDEIRPTALKKGLVLLFHSECTSKTIACADPGKTRQIIYNLIDNSLKYTPKGSVDVTVRDDIAFKKIYVSIKDTGVGIDEEGMKEVFEKFVRAKNANEVNVSGSGLGLYVARQMAEAMQGKITVESEGLKKGSTFTLELPLVE